jgi:hypothetical protein
MTGGSPQVAGEWFTAPEQGNHRRYEALRAFHVQGLTHAQAADRFGYTRWAMVNLVREHRAGRLDLFAPTRKPGPPPGSAPAKDRARGRVSHYADRHCPPTRSPRNWLSNTRR